MTDLHLNSISSVGRDVFWGERNLQGRQLKGNCISRMEKNQGPKMFPFTLVFFGCVSFCPKKNAAFVKDAPPVTPQKFFRNPFPPQPATIGTFLVKKVLKLLETKVGGADLLDFPT